MFLNEPSITVQIMVLFSVSFRVSLKRSSDLDHQVTWHRNLHSSHVPSHLHSGFFPCQAPQASLLISARLTLLLVHLLWLVFAFSYINHHKNVHKQRICIWLIDLPVLLPIVFISLFVNASETLFTTELRTRFSIQKLHSHLFLFRE